MPGNMDVKSFLIWVAVMSSGVSGNLPNGVCNVAGQASYVAKGLFCLA